MTLSANSKVWSTLKVIGINVAVLGVLLVGVEGLASFALLAGVRLALKVGRG